jgi:hypothetical protein
MRGARIGGEEDQMSCDWEQLGDLEGGEVEGKKRTFFSKSFKIPNRWWQLHALLLAEIEYCATS